MKQSNTSWILGELSL